MQAVATELDDPTARFLAENHVERAWRSALRLAVDHIPGLRDVRARLVHDPEIPGDEHVRIEALAIGDIDQILDCRDRWFAAFRKEVGSAAAEFFVLSVEPLE